MIVAEITAAKASPAHQTRLATVALTPCVISTTDNGTVKVSKQQGRGSGDTTGRQQFTGWPDRGVNCLQQKRIEQRGRRRTQTDELAPEPT